VGEPRVAADAQHLSIPFLELRKVVFQVLEFGGSAAGEIGRVESQHHPFAGKLGQGELLARG
jgi:hypothetical protein